MNVVPILLMVSLVYFDARFLCNIKDCHFKKHLFVPHFVVFLFACLLGLTILISKEKIEAIIFLTTFNFFLIYFLRRRTFLNNLRGDLLSRKSLAEEPISSEDLMALGIDAFSVLIRVLIILFGVALGIKVFDQMFSAYLSEFGKLLLSAAIFFVLIIIFIHKASSKFSSQGFWENIGFARKQKSFLRKIIIPASLGLIFAFISTGIILSREIHPSTPLSEIIQETSSETLLMLFLGLAVLIAPLVEEIIFRGYFYRVLCVVKGEKFAIILISFSFAALHVGQYWKDWQAIIIVSILGFVLTLIRAWSKTLTSSVIMHYVYNAGIVFIHILFS